MPWLPLVRGPRRRLGAAAPEHGSAAVRTEDAPLRITRRRTAWALAVFFGLQATAAYITMGWMPQIFRDAGVSAGDRRRAARRHHGDGRPARLRDAPGRHPDAAPGPARGRRSALCGLAGYAGLWLAPAAGAWAWALLLGISNCAFPLALTMIGMRAESSAGVAKLSAFAQSTGYLISIPGPLLVGVLYQHSGGWGLPIALMAGLMVPQIGDRACWRAGTASIEDETLKSATLAACQCSNPNPQNGQKKLLIVLGAMLGHHRDHRRSSPASPRRERTRARGRDGPNGPGAGGWWC